MPRDRPRATDFAAGRTKGDVSGPESVALAASRGSPARQMARDSPRETPEAAGRAEGDAPGVEGFAFGALRDMHGTGRAEGDAPRADSVALGASRDTRTRLTPQNQKGSRVDPDSPLLTPAAPYGVVTSCGSRR